jgi:hypothetical protein
VQSEQTNTEVMHSLNPDLGSKSVAFSTGCSFFSWCQTLASTEGFRVDICTQLTPHSLWRACVLGRLGVVGDILFLPVCDPMKSSSQFPMCLTITKGKAQSLDGESLLVLSAVV